MSSLFDYSISQQSGGSHEDDEPATFDLVVRNEEGQDKLLREGSYEDAVELAHKHAKYYNQNRYLINDRLFE